MKQLGTTVTLILNWILLGAVAYKVFGGWGLAAAVGSFGIGWAINLVVGR